MPESGLRRKNPALSLRHHLQSGCRPLPGKFLRGKFKRVEQGMGNFSQRSEIVDGEGSGAQRDQAISAQFHQALIQMYERDTKKISELLLGHWHFESKSIALDGPALGQPEAKLKQQVGDALQNRAATEANNPSCAAGALPRQPARCSEERFRCHSQRIFSAPSGESARRLHPTTPQWRQDAGERTCSSPQRGHPEER